tara:strand:+ start:194 stop:904 length:711 start_codon:yes stop_codon:yes gene_type:complete
MGKKKKDFNTYDYLKENFDDQYVDFESGNVKPSSRNAYTDQQAQNRYNEALNRYMLTGEIKSTGGHMSHVDNEYIKRNATKKSKAAQKLFDEGIPPSQWAYYIDKAGVNFNSKKDAKAVIAAYNPDERFTADQAGEMMDEKLEDYKKNEAANSATKDLKDRVLSEHMQDALDTVSKWEKGNPPVPIFPEGIRAQHQGNPVRQLTQDIDIANLTRPESFLENYKQEILDEYGFERVI